MALNYLEHLQALTEKYANTEYPADALLLSGRAYRATGNIRRAIADVMKASNIRLRVFGPMSPQFAVCLDALGSLKRDVGDVERAEQLYRQACLIQAMHEQPDFSASLNNLGTLYVANARYTEAKQLYLEVVWKRLQILGERHYLVASALNNLGELYFMVGDKCEGKAVFDHAITILRQEFPDGHFRTARTLLNYASWLIELNETNFVEKMIAEAEDIVLATLGERHSLFQRCRKLRIVLAQ